MSQTNEFAKAILPDYVYFDLQTTNLHNNEVGTIPQLRFEESRDAPVIENAGEYNMSVTRFSVDTATLPVLVVEPDINVSNDHFDATKTIHRVAIITESANLTIDTTGTITTTNVESFIGPNGASKFGTSVASSTDGEVIVIGEPLTNLSIYVPPYVTINPEEGYNNRPSGFLNIIGRGDVYIGIRRPDGTYALDKVSDGCSYDNASNIRTGTITLNWEVGREVAISGDGKVIFFGSGSSCPYYWILNRNTGHLGRFNKTLHSTQPSWVVGALNTTGTYLVVGYPVRETSGNGTGGYEILSYDITTNQSSSKISVNGALGVNGNMGYAVAINGTGNIVAIMNTGSSSGGVIDVIYSSSAPYFVSSTTTSYTGSDDGFGTSISMNNAGTIIAVGAHLEASTGPGCVRILNFASPSTITSSAVIVPNTSITSPASFTGAIEFGRSCALSYDGNTIHIGSPHYGSNRGAVQTFQYNGSAWVYKSQSQGNAVNSFYGNSLKQFHDGTEYIAGSGSSTLNSGARVSRINIATNETLPTTLRNTASVASVYWTPDNTTLTPPSKTELNGVNTATFPYYYCHSYNNFIDKVNDAIKEAYVANFNKLWTEWINILSVNNVAFIKAEFINIVARCFSTPPYLDWNPSLDANVYLNTLFTALDNYYYPARTYAPSGANPNTQVSTNGASQPLNLRLAFNASLYSLFAGFPATETIIDGERFYMLNVPKQVASLLDNSTIPLRALPLMPYYPFLYDYYNNATKVFTLPYPANSVSTYPLQEYFIRLKQEISTIDAWCPISSIVFTSNQLPIIVSQFSSTNTIGNTPSTATIGNRFALVITDLMTNQQGYRPNVIYNPSAEYRRISLTGNLPVRDIDINVFWRPKTGQLLPFRLQSGGSASLKLLFEKKNKNPEKEKVEEPVSLDIMGGRMRSRR